MQPEPEWGGVFAGAGAWPGEGLVTVRSAPAQLALWLPGGKPVYLATPYSREVVDCGRWQLGLSVRAAARASVEVRRLMLAGVTAISPVVMSADVVHSTLYLDAGMRADPLDWQGWMTWCRPLQDACCAVVVPDLPGWQRSHGIRAEVGRAMERGQRVYFYAAGDGE